MPSCSHGWQGGALSDRALPHEHWTHDSSSSLEVRVDVLIDVDSGPAPGPWAAAPVWRECRAEATQETTDPGHARLFKGDVRELGSSPTSSSRDSGAG